MTSQSPPYVPGHSLLAGRTAVITAAAGAGIGGATARRFLQEGARVVVGDAHERRLKESAAALSEEFGADNVAGLPCDVTDEQQVDALFALAAERHGGLDVVVNNAGLGGTADLVDMTDDQWQRLRRRLAGPARPGPLRRGQGRGHGPHPVRRPGGRGLRRTGQRRRPEPRHAPRTW